MRSALACWLAIVAVLLAGCGGKNGPSDNGIRTMTPQQILVQMKQAVAGASSVHIVGGGTSDGSTLTLDLQLVAGTGGAGHISVGGLSFDVVKIGPKLYFKGEQAFLKRYAGTAASLFAGRWFEVSTAVPQFASFASLTNIVKLTNNIVASAGTLTKGSTTTIDGQPALAIVDSGNGGGTLYVATTGPAYPLELDPARGKGGIKFTDWDQPVTLKAPANPLDFAKLTGR
ncbi:MAG TPA: hypothetical protein VH063_15025 [Gaiellaceae bacterium]|jgi:hypothetical protein|nr:hypothetical protein [Gaiellaceae bacterium]